MKCGIKFEKCGSLTWYSLFSIMPSMGHSVRHFTIDFIINAGLITDQQHYFNKRAPVFVITPVQWCHIEMHVIEAIKSVIVLDGMIVAADYGINI